MLITDGICMTFNWHRELSDFLCAPSGPHTHTRTQHRSTAGHIASHEVMLRYDRTLSSRAHRTLKLFLTVFDIPLGDLDSILIHNYPETIFMTKFILVSCRLYCKIFVFYLFLIGHS